MNLKLALFFAIFVAFIALSFAGPVHALEPASPDNPDDVHNSDNLQNPDNPETRAWGVGKSKSYLVPALEIPAFEASLNLFDRLVFSEHLKSGKKTYNTNLKTFWNNLTDGHWEIDHDPFDINQIGHPYSGSIYQGFARSSGLGFWESSVYTFLGSFMWETAGETTNPSINDMVASGIAGNFLGEPLFRMSNLVLEGSGDKPPLWRELVAFVISPPTGVNRLVFGDRFKPVFPSYDPDYFWRFRAGDSINSHGEGGGVPRDVASADFAISYGLPGKEGYSYTRPFDNFNFEFAVGPHKYPVECLLARGLLFGDGYEAGKDLKGVWGVYGSYDYLAPYTFKAANTALSLGTDFRSRISPGVAMNGFVSGGAGYGAAGIDTGKEQLHRTYRYGTTVQGLVTLGLSLGDIAMVEGSAREYYVTGLGGTSPHGTELIGRYSGVFTLRLYGNNGVSFQYLSSTRDGGDNNKPRVHQTVETYSLMYTYLSDRFFGAL
jgi:Domain of unknown function (DUF3943)